MLPVPTVEHLANHTGRPVESYSAFAEQTLTQATLLFSIVTKLQEYPEDEDQQQLAVAAILEMADRMYLEQPYQAMYASPFQSESTGSYSYSKSATAIKARTGQTTGLFWWDLAVDELSIKGSSNITSGSIAVMPGDITTDGENRWVVGPAEDIDPPYIRIS